LGKENRKKRSNGRHNNTVFGNQSKCGKREERIRPPWRGPNKGKWVINHKREGGIDAKRLGGGLGGSGSKLLVENPQRPRSFFEDGVHRGGEKRKQRGCPQPDQQSEQKRQKNQ